MAKFKRNNLQLKTNQRIQLGDSQESLIKYDGSQLKLYNADGISLGDPTPVITGGTDELEIYTSGSSLILSSKRNAGIFKIHATTSGGSSQEMISAAAGGQVTLNYGGGPRVQTSNTGVNLYGVTSAVGLQASGASFDINGLAAPTVTSDGGDINIVAGEGGATSGAGGNILIEAGEGDVTATDGAISLVGQVTQTLPQGAVTARYTLSNESSMLVFHRPNGALNEKNFVLWNFAGNYLSIGTQKDDFSGGSWAMQFHRDGTTISHIETGKPFRAQSGFGGLPHYSFTSATNSGMFYDATAGATGPALSESSASRLTVTSNGLRIRKSVAPTTDVANYGYLYIDQADDNILRYRDENGTVSGLMSVFTEDTDENIFGGTGAGASLTSEEGLRNFFAGVGAGALVTTGDENIAIGKGALPVNITSNSNIAIGEDSLLKTTSALNIAIGVDAGRAISSGGFNIAIGPGGTLGSTLASFTGSSNIAIGLTAIGGSGLTTATSNIGIGNNSLTALTSGSSNLVIGEAGGNRITSAIQSAIYGHFAGTSITTGTRNIAIGSSALGESSASLTGQNNIAIGRQSIYSSILSTATENIGIGTNTLNSLSTGSYNVAIGQDSLDAITTGNDNVAIGDGAGRRTEATAIRSVYIGKYAGGRNAGTHGNYTTAVGGYSMGGTNDGASNENTALGFYTLYNIKTAYANTAVGVRAGGDLTDASYGVYIGADAGAGITTGSYNIVMGYQALSVATASITGTLNIAIGRSAMRFSTTTVSSNLAIGAYSLSAVTGDKNVAIGEATQTNITTGGNNTSLGYYSGVNFDVGSTGNVTIGYMAGPGLQAEVSNQLYINNAQGEFPLIGGDFSTGAIRLKGTIRLTERGDHIGTPTSPYGEIWLRSGTPNTLMFTDDAGTDYDLVNDVDIVNDTSPQLGGTLDTNGFNIVGKPAATSTSAGSNVNIIAAAGGATSGNGGSVTLTSGTATSGAGGSIGLTARPSTLATATGGGVTITAGAGGPTSGQGGPISISAGDGTGTGTGGNITLTAGESDTGSAGSIIIPAQIAPSTTTDKLYNISGDLTWNGKNLTSQLYFGATKTLETNISGVTVFDTFGNDPQITFAGADLAVNNRIESKDDGSMVLYDVINADNLLYAFALGPVALYYAGGVRFQTSNAGATVTGVLQAGGIRSNVDEFNITTSNTEDAITINKDGSVELFYDDSLKLATDATGVTVIGNLTTNDLTVDGNSIILGSTYLTEAPGGGLTVDGDVVCDSVTSSSDTLQLGAGEMSWNPDDYTMDIPTGLGPVLQVGQEDYIIVYNDTGEDIPNGTPVYPVGAIGTTPKVAPAKADVYSNFSGNVLMTTMIIPNGQIGICSERGKVRDVDTSSFNIGDVLWISDTVAGELVNVEPDFPAYGIQIGGVLVSDNTGVIELAIRGDDSHSTIVNAWNGVFRETFDFRITESGGVVTGTLTPSNSNVDMTMMFSDGFSLLDTSSANIVLVSGSDTVPQTNYIYVLKSTKVLTVSTSSWPVTEHIRVANVVLQSAATTGTQGALRNQNWNDHVAGTDFQGHLSHIGAAIREKIQATWRSGTAGASTIDTGSTPDDVWVTVTGGIVQQMHEQAFPSFDTETGDILHIVNHSTTPYVTTSNLNTQILDSNGVTLNSTSFSFVLWGVANKAGEASQLMINLPTGSYAFNTPANAVSDALNYSVYSIPAQFSGVGFLIARFTYTYKSDAWVLFDTEDLRGKIPNTTAGGGGGGSGVTDFLQLTDTPSVYTSQALKYLRVAAGETAIEFSDADLATTEYVDDVNIHKIDPPSVTQTYSGTIIENVTIDSTSSAFGTLVYRTTSGIYTEAIGLSDDTISTAIVVGSSTVLIEGFVRDDALYAFGGGNLGKKIYLSPTVPGETVVTIPSGSGDVIQIVGEIWDNTTILFRPNSTSVEII